MPDAHAPPTAPDPLEARVEALADAVERLVGRLDAFVDGSEVLPPVVTRAPDVVATIVDSFDETYSRAASSGIDLDARVHDLLRLAERLSAPETVEVLMKLAGRIDRLDRVLTLLDQAPGLVAILVDSADELAAKAQANGIDFERGVARGIGAALRFGAMLGPAEMDGLEALLRSGVLAPDTVRFVGGMGQAMRASAAGAPRPVGAVGLLRAMRDPDAQRALGFLAVFARELGRRLDGGPIAGGSASPEPGSSGGTLS